MLYTEKNRDRFQTMRFGIYSVAPHISVCPGVDWAYKNEYQDNYLFSYLMPG
jgi:hypothetical protein